MTHECLHEEQILNQSKTIERLDAELSYKKERLDDLKEDNRRMETKIDDIKDCMNKLMLKSKTDDDQLQNRLTAIETEQKVIKEMQDKNRADTNLKLYFIVVIFTVVSVVIGLISFYLSYIR